MLKDLKAEDQEKVFTLASDIFRIRYADSDVLVEHDSHPKEVVGSWHESLMIAGQLVRMYNEAR